MTSLNSLYSLYSVPTTARFVEINHIEKSSKENKNLSKLSWVNYMWNSSLSLPIWPYYIVPLSLWLDLYQLTFNDGKFLT